MKKRIYIAGPLTKGSLLHNVKQADEAFARLMRAGFAPLCPHWSVFHGSIAPRPLYVGETEHHGRKMPLWDLAAPLAKADTLPGDTTHADWMGVDLPWVAVSDAVLRLPGESVGADIEVAEAERRGVPVFHEIDDLIRWGTMFPEETPCVG